MKAHNSVLVMALALAACGGDDDAADVDAAEAPVPDELTGQDILDRLLEVDGDDSGLDADTIDGIDSDGLARAGRRTVTIQHDNVAALDDLPEAGSSGINVRLYMPPDIVAGEPIDLVLIGQIAGAAPCGMRILAGASPYQHGAILAAVEGEIDGQPQTTVTVPDGDLFELEATFESEDFVPGNWGLFSIGRDHDHAQDTCTTDFDLVGIAFEYTAR